jgi:hypothetical protein
LDYSTSYEDAARTLISAIEALRSEGALHEDRKPLSAFIPTMGISSGKEDVPL